MGRKIQLWTWQGKCLDLHSGRVDPSKGEYAESLPQYLPTVLEVAGKLGTDQFIWASREFRRHGGRIGYRLEVPEDRVLAVLDGFLWNLRIGSRRILPPSELKTQWESEAAKRHPQDGQARRKWVEARQRRWEERPLPDDWWERAKEAGAASEDPHYILPFPIPEEWEVERA